MFFAKGCRCRVARLLMYVGPISCICCAGLLGCGANRASPDATQPAAHATALRAAFPLLRGKSQPATKQMERRMGEGSGERLRAHEASTPNGPIWLVSSDSGRICLFAGRPPASACESRSSALRKGLTLGVVEAAADPDRRRFILYGVIPDRRRAIRVKIGAHEIRTIRVRDGAFSWRASEPVFKL